MHIQITEAVYTALTASQIGYIMKQRGDVEIKVFLQTYRWLVNFTLWASVT